MAIAVTSLGTKQGKAVTSIAFSYADGLVATANDWIVACFAGDWSTGAADYSTGSVQYELYKNYEINNSGQAYAAIYSFRIPTTTASGHTITISAASSGAMAATFYKVTGIEYETSIGDITTATGGSSGLDNNWDAAGNVVTNASPCTISSVDFQLSKTGNPTGTAYARVYNRLTGSLIGTIGSLDVTTLDGTATWKTFSGTNVTITDNAPHIICVEHADGIALNYIYVHGGGANKSSYLAHGIQHSKGGSWQVSAAQNAYLMRNVTGGKHYNPADKTNNLTGSDGVVAIPSVGTLSQADEIGFAVAALEDKPADVPNTWTSGSGYISGNTQKNGTTGSGDASNITVGSAASIVSSTTALQATQTGNGSIDFAALIQTYRASGTAPAVSIGAIAQATHFVGLGGF